MAGIMQDGMALQGHPFTGPFYADREFPKAQSKSVSEASLLLRQNCNYVRNRRLAGTSSFIAGFKLARRKS